MRNEEMRITAGGKKEGEQFDLCPPSNALQHLQPVPSSTVEKTSRCFTIVWPGEMLNAFRNGRAFGGRPESGQGTQGGQGECEVKSLEGGSAGCTPKSSGRRKGEVKAEERRAEST